VKQQVIPIVGGLELVTDKLSVNPGTAQYCLNYEVAQQRGIRRIDGFSRWDGRRNLADDATCLTIGASEVGGAGLGWYQGDTITIGYVNNQNVSLTVQALVLSTANSGDPDLWSYEAVVLLLSELVSPPSPITDSLSYATRRTGTPLVIDYASIADSSGADALYRSLVTAIPGNDKTRIPGLHFFNDKLYAVADLPAIEVTPVEGALIEGASLYCTTQTAPFGTIALTRPATTAGNSIIELFDYTSDVSLSGAIYWPVSSGELVPNGTFTDATNWTLNAWTVGAGVASLAAAATSNLVSSLTAVSGYAYEVTYTMTARSTGGVTVSFGGDTGTARNAVGTYTETLIATTTTALTFAGGAFTGSIDNVSVRIVDQSVVPEGDFATVTTWTAGAGWSTAGNIATATASNSTLTSTLAAGVNTRKYRVVYTITRSAGTVTASIGGVSGTARSAAGTYVDFITATGAGVLTFTGSGFTGTVDNVAVYVVAGVATYVGTAEPERAALYYADWDGAGGWSRQDMGRIVQYTEGSSSDATAFFLPYSPPGFVSEIDSAELVDTGWVGADGIGTTLGGGLTWSSASQADLSENDGTTVASQAATGIYYTALLVATFSADVLAIPAGAIVRGVEVSVFRFASHVNTCSDKTITIGKTGGTVGANRAAVGFIPATPATEAVYGSSTDLWQLALNPSDINDGGFQVQVAFDILGGTPSKNMYVDQIRIKVHYQPQSRKAYVYSPTNVPTDQEIEVVHFTVSEGTAGGGTNGNRKGLLVLNPAKTVSDSLKAWQFAPGMQIRTQAAGAGSLLAELASDDDPITLPSSYTVAAEGARYQFSDARPYARDNADVFFVCSGAEYAYMMADGYALPIQTGLLEQFEKPRHARWAGNYLALGYPTGTLSLSDLGDPLTYLSAASVAADIGASDRVTGLLKLKGDSLGVFTERTIFALQGSEATSLQRIEISPSSGAIEYTVTDGPTGSPMFCDFRGIATVETTQNYGDFDRPGIGDSASPWLIERLQANRRNQTVDKTVVAAYPMRNKRQYRVLFNDGWQSTLTVQPDGASVVTTQRYYGDWQDRDTSAITVLAIATGVTSTGQDLAFMSFDVDPESSRYRYVFQIDAGRSFDGEEIIAQWMGQPLILGGPFFTKTLYQIGFYGRAYGYADLKVFCATDFTDPVSDESTSASTTGTDVAFGTTAASTESNFKAMANIRAQGEDFTFLVESITATELPHTIQSMVVRFESEEPKR